MTQITVKRASVMLREGCMDRIALYLDAEPLTCFSEDEVCADLDAAAGTGVEWVRKNIGLEPEIIDARNKTPMKFSRDKS